MLSGKTAIITGGSSGIGLGIAKAFLKHDASVILLSRDVEKLKKTQDMLGHKAHIFSCDLIHLDTIKQVIKHVQEQFSTIDVLVNNAGVARFNPFESSNEAELDQHWNLNVKAPFMLTCALLPMLIESKGSVINISSYFSQRMLHGRPSSIYSMTKGAIDSLTKALAFELGVHGIRVNAIAPGTVNTPMMQHNVSVLNSQQQAAFCEAIQTNYPLGCMGSPEDVANIAAFLASNQAQWITGSRFTVDGGLTTH